MDVQLEISTRLDEILKTAIKTRWSESALETNDPEDLTLILSALSIAETAQFPGLVARGEDLDSC